MRKLSKINYFKNKLKRLLTIVVICCCMAFASQVKAFSHILLKGLFQALKHDDIGFAHALLHSRFIENLYQYGAGSSHKKIKIKKGKDTTWKAKIGEDPVANLIRKFWFRKRENHLLMPTQFGCLANIPDDQWGKMFGMLMNYVYRGCNVQSETVLLDTIFSYDPQAQEFKRDLHEHCKLLVLEKEKLENKKFDPVKQAYQELREKRDEIKLQYNMGLFKEEMVVLRQASATVYPEQGRRAKASEDKQDKQAKKRLRGKALKEAKKKLKEKYDKGRYVKALRKAERDIFEKISKETRDEYDEALSKKKKLGERYSKKLAQKRNLVRKTVCDPIRKALEFCKRGDMYVSRTAESILWALFFHRLDGFISEKAKVQAINDCLVCIEPEFKRKEFNGVLSEFYVKEDFVEFERELFALDADKQIDLGLQNYDLGLHYLLYLAVGALPPVVTQVKIGYEYEPGKMSHVRPNCHETAILDLFSILWHDPVKRSYNNALFDPLIIKYGQGFKKLRQVLKYFYLADCKCIDPSEYTCECELTLPGDLIDRVKFTSLAKLKSLGRITQEEVDTLDVSKVPVEYINRPEVKQEFFNIVSNIPGIIYRSEIHEGKGPVFEIRSNAQNVLNICNYFYGTNAENIGELTGREIGLSTDSRIVAFRKKNRQDSIRVNIEDNENNTEFNLVIKIGETHTRLVVFDREKKSSCLLEKGIAQKLLHKIVSKSVNKGEKLTSFFMLLNSQELLKNKEVTSQLPLLHLMLYSLGMKKARDKLAILEYILEWHPSCYESCKEMIHNLVERLPRNNQEIKGKLSELIVRTGFYKYPFFENFIKFKVLNDPDFFQDQERVGSLFLVALKYEYQNILQAIIKRLNNWEHSLWAALGKKRPDLAVAILKNPACNLNFTATKEILILALKSGYVQVALALIKHPGSKMNFKGVYKVFQVIVEKKYTQVAIEILKNHARFKDAGIFLYWLLEQGHSEIVCAVLEDPTFTFKYMVAESGRLLRLAVERGYKQIALSLVKSPAFNALCPGVADALKRALQGGYADIILAVLEHPTFTVHIIGTEYTLALAREEGDQEAIFYGDGIHEAKWNEFFVMALDMLYQDPVELCQREAARIIVSKFVDVPESPGWAYVLKVALEKGYIDFATEILKKPYFKADFTGVKNVLRQALELGYKKFALEVVKHPTFSGCQYGIIDGCEWALQEGYEYIVLEALENPHFSPDTKSLINLFVFAVQNGYKKVISQIINHPEFDSWGCALELALEERHKKMLEMIMREPDLGAKGNKIKKAMLLALQNKSYQKIILSLINSPEFDGWGSALKVALEKGDTLRQAQDDRVKENYKSVALEIINHPKFIAKGSGMAEALVLALHNLVCRQEKIASRIMSNPTFEGWGDAVIFALRKKYRAIALEIIKHPAFDAAGDSGEKVLLDENGVFGNGQDYKEFALAVVNHPRFDVDKPWVQEHVDLMRKCVQEDADDDGVFGEILECIERKQKENNKI